MDMTPRPTNSDAKQVREPGDACAAAEAWSRGIVRPGRGAEATCAPAAIQS